MAKSLQLQTRLKYYKCDGVQKVVHWDTGAAVIADNTWRAMQAAKALSFDIDSKGNEQLDSKVVNRLLQQKLQTSIDHVKEEKNNSSELLNRPMTL